MEIEIEMCGNNVLIGNLKMNLLLSTGREMRDWDVEISVGISAIIIMHEIVA